MRVKIPVDSNGDDGRIVKYADIELWATRGFFRTGAPYEAVHRPTGIKSGADWYAQNKPEWAITDCVSKVLDSMQVRPFMSQIDAAIIAELK